MRSKDSAGQRKFTRREVGAMAGLSVLWTALPLSVWAADTPRIKQLTIGRITDINVPDPDANGVAQQAFLVNVFDTLIRYTNNLNAQPGLATSWTWNAEKTQLTLKLRDGIKFHSGNAFTADDVVFTLKRVQDPKIGSGQLATMAKWVTSSNAPDPHTLVLNFDQPRPGFLDALSFLYIADKGVLEHGDPAKNVSGTGPYKLAQWRPGQGFTLDRNTSYWETTVGPDRIVANVISDAEALSAQLSSGAIQMAEGLSERSASLFTRDKRYTLVRNDFGPEYYYLGMNVTKAPFDNVDVRQAFVYALDKKRFVDSTLKGLGEATSAPWPPQSPVYDPASRDKYGFDLDKAKALLDKAGVKNLEVHMMTATAWQPLLEQAQQYQADLAKIGVKLDIDVVDVGRWQQEINHDHTQAIWTGGFGFSQYDPASLFAMAAPWRMDNSMPQYKNADLTKMVNAATSEPDDQKRVAEVKQITDFFQNQAFTNPISRRVPVVVEGPGVSGAAYDVTGAVSFKNVVAK
jgi:peptide/nickel transport system substrate-binding protein